MVIGQSPGRTEVEKGRPFCGASGELLDFLLDELLLDRTQVYVTNTLKCHPNDNRPGTVEEILTCKKKWLLPELKLVRPRVILTLGKDAFISLKGSAKGFAHGHVWRLKNRSLVCFYHPAYFLRRKDIDSFLEHTGRIQDELDFWESNDE
jgi:DNA polymerase